MEQLSGDRRFPKRETQALWVNFEEAAQATQNVQSKVMALEKNKGAGSRDSPVG